MLRTFLRRQRWVTRITMFLLAQGIFGHDTSSLRFDVGEIKIDSSNSVPDYEFVDGRLRIINIDLKGLIQLAMFGTVRGARPVFGPAVLDTVRVDVIAKAESPATSIPDARAMLLNLLKDRMQLKFHFENREMPAYALIRNGANFEMPESQGPPGQCDASSTLVQVPKEDLIAGVPELLQAKNRPHYKLDCRNVSMAELAIRLSMYSDQPVVDQTDSAGLRTFMLDFEPSKNSPDAALGRAVSGLGLKVRPSRFPVPVLVVDSVAAKPTVE